MTSRDFSFLTLRDLTAYGSNGATIKDNYVLTVSSYGKQLWTNNLILNNITASTINISTISASTISFQNCNINLGMDTGSTLQGSNTIAIGCHAGQSNQSSFSVAIGQNAGEVAGIKIQTKTIPLKNINTISLYLNPLRQRDYYNYIVESKPKRVVFNPGTENPELYQLLQLNAIEYEIACTLVLLTTNQF